jgi:hypothetical protein
MKSTEAKPKWARVTGSIGKFTMALEEAEICQ